MSTTAEQTTLTPTHGSAESQPAETEAPAQPKAAETEPAPKSSSREYTLFEEARSETWTRIGTANADTQEAALDTLGEQKLKSGQRFMAIPSRFVRPVKPKVTTVTTVSYD